MWDLKTGQQTRELNHPDLVDAVAVSPDGKSLATGCHDGQLRVWDLKAGDSVTLAGHEGQVLRVAFSPDGKQVASAAEDKTARLWDAATGKQLGPPLLHAGLINTVAFRPFGRALVTGCEDGSVLLWPVPGEEPGDVEAVRRRMESLTGMRLDDRGIIRWAGAESAP